MRKKNAQLHWIVFYSLCNKKEKKRNTTKCKSVLLKCNCDVKKCMTNGVAFDLYLYNVSSSQKIRQNQRNLCLSWWSRCQRTTNQRYVTSWHTLSAFGRYSTTQGWKTGSTNSHMCSAIYFSDLPGKKLCKSCLVRVIPFFVKSWKSYVRQEDREKFGV